MLYLFVKTIINTYLLRNHLKCKYGLVSILCRPNYVCIYAHLCEYGIMSRWPFMDNQLYKSEMSSVMDVHVYNYI